MMVRPMNLDIPVVDISGLFSDSSGAAVEAIATEVRAACLDTGFFYVSGHGIAEDLMAGVLAANRAFHWRFQLPEGEIQALETELIEL